MATIDWNKVRDSDKTEVTAVDPPPVKPTAEPGAAPATPGSEGATDIDISGVSNLGRIPWGDPRIPQLQGPNLGVMKMPRPGSVPTQLSGLGLTPVADATLANPDSKFLQEHGDLLKALETQAQGGDPDTFFSHVKKAWRKDKDLASDIIGDAKQSYLSSYDTQELLNLRAKQVMGQASQTESDRAGYLSAKRKPWATPNSVYNEGFFAEMPGKLAGMAGSMAGDWKSFADKTGAGIILGGTAGSVIPVLGTAAGAVGGGKVAFGMAMADNMARTSMGEFYDKMLKAKMPDGSPVDEKVARGAALIVGGANGLLGALPLAGVLSKSGLGTRLVGPGAAAFLGQYIADPAVAAVLSRVAVQFGSGVGAQALVGGVQSLLDTIAEKGITHQPITLDDAMTRMAEGARGGAQMGFSIGALEVALHQAASSVAYHENAGKVVNEAFDGNRDKAKTFFDDVGDANGQRDRTLPRAHVEAILREAKLEGESLKAAMPGVFDQMTKTDGDPNAEIRFTPGEMSAYIAPTKGFEAAKGDMRAGAQGLTLNEIKKLVKNTAGDTEALKAPETAGQMALRHAAEQSVLKEGHAEELAKDPSAATRSRQDQAVTALTAKQTAEKNAPTAASQSVDYAKRVLNPEPLFSDKDKGDMTDGQLKKYQAELDRAIASSQSDIEKTVLKAIKDEGVGALAKHKEAVRQELIANDNTHSLDSYLKIGERLDDGSIPLDGEENHKLDTDDLRRMGVSEGELTQLADYHAKDGLDPRTVARSFNMSAHEMVEALKNHTPLDEAVNNRVATDMPGFVEPSSWLKGRAVEMLSNDVIPKMMEAEYHALGGRETYEQIRSAVINSLRYNKVFSLDPEHFFREYHRLGEAVREARANELNGKTESAGPEVGKEYAKLQAEQREILGAHPDGNGLSPDEEQRLKIAVRRMGELDAKYNGSAMRAAGGEPSPFAKSGESTLSSQELQRRRINAFETWKIARQALEDQSRLNALMDHMRDNMALRKQLAVINPRGLQAFDSALEAYGAKNVDPTQAQAHPIAEYVEAERKKPGTDIVEDPELEARAEARNDIGKLTVNQLRNAKAFMESLYHHVVIDAPNFMADGKSEPVETVVGRLVKGIVETGIVNRNDRGMLRNWVTRGLRGAASSLIKAEFLIRHLDGGDIHGELARTIWQPLVEAEGREAVMQGEVDKVLRAHVDNIYDGSLSGESSLKVSTKGFEKDTKGNTITNPDKQLSKTELLSALLNGGSARNRTALLQGYGITWEALLKSAGQDLSSKHLEFVNQFWALHEKYFPDVAATYAKRNGIPLEAVKSLPFSVTGNDGKTVKMTGGYVPIKYGEDAKYINKAYNVQGYQDPSINVNDSMVEGRNGSFGAVELNLARVLGGLRAKVHYATTYDAIQNVAKIVMHPDFQQAIKDTVGGEFNNTLQDALRHMARDGMPMQPLSTWDKAVKFIQSGAAQTHVAWNHITAFAQPIFGAAQATAKIGPGYMGKAALEVMSNWHDSWKTAMEESNVLWTMGEDPTLAKVIQPVFQDISVPLQDKIMGLGHGKVFQNVMDVKHFLSELGMAHQQNTRQMAGLVAYTAAKMQGIAENRPDPVAYADAALRQTIGGTGAKDLPNLLANPSIARGYVNYYSHRALIASELLERIMTARSEGSFTRDQLLQTSKTVAGWLVVPALTMAAMRQTYKDAPPDVGRKPGATVAYASQQLGAALVSDLAPGVGDIAASALQFNAKQGHSMGGPIGQAAGDVRSSMLGLLDDRHKVNYQAMANVASFLGQVPLGGMTKDLDELEGIFSGRYDASHWYDIQARGPTKGRK